LGQSKSSVIDHVYQCVAPGAAHPVFGERMTATSCSWCSWGISVGVFWALGRASDGTDQATAHRRPHRSAHRRRRGQAVPRPIPITRTLKVWLPSSPVRRRVRGSSGVLT